MSKFQSLIGECQWMISLCRFDIALALMSLSCFCHCPHPGHIDCLKHVCGYIQKFPQGAICFRTGILDHESFFKEAPTKYDWMETVYRCLVEEILDKAPTAKGKPVCTTTYVDANLLHHLTMGRSATGLLHFFNQTPLMHFQSTRIKWNQQPIVLNSWLPNKLWSKLLTYDILCRCLVSPLMDHPGCLVTINQSL